MDAELFQDLPVAERREQLEANADAIEHLGYTRSLPSEEVDSLKEQLMSVQIKIEEKQEELKEKSKELNTIIKDYKESRKKVTAKLKTRSEYIEEDCYKMVDSNRREVGYYNKEGKLVYSRPARKEELQKSIFQEIRSTGTDGE
jgi:chromosome segregation ATPase